MFISALASISGKNNRLGLPKAKSACVVVVDGLGSANLRFRAGHASFLNKQLSSDGSIMCGFPSTTVTSLTSFATGLRAGEHGLVGYQIFDKAEQRNMNLLTGIASAEEAVIWQKSKTVAEMANEEGIDCYFVGPAEYEASGFTHATMRGAKYVAAKTLEDRVQATKKIMSEKSKALVYLYVPELDQRAHAFGFKSREWLEKLEDLDSAIRDLIQSLPANCGALLTADHGIVDVDHQNQVYLDELDLPGLVSVGGDPRVLFLYLDTADLTEMLTELKTFFGKRAFVATKKEVVDAGWYGKVNADSLNRMPDIFIIASGQTALYHRDFAKPKSLKMIGQHGSISEDELFVPLLRFGAFAKKN